MQGLTKEQAMRKGTRRQRCAQFKANVVLAALAGDRTLAELVQQVGVHPNQTIDWKRPISERAADVFGKSGAFDQPVDSKSTRAKIGRLTLKKDFLK
jgi:transposase-like protein